MPNKMDNISDRIMRAKKILRQAVRNNIINSGVITKSGTSDSGYTLEQLVDIYDIYSSMSDKSIIREMWQRGYEWKNSHWHKEE